MRAIELTGLDGPESLKLIDVERPEPGASEVLVEVKAAGVNFADVEITRGGYPVSRPLPYVIGFEAAGVVVDVGRNVTGLRRGDRVAAMMAGGAYAEYAIVDAANAIPIPKGVSFADATAVMVQGITAYALLAYRARVQPHESILIQAAAGGVGLFLVQLARIMGVERIIALAGTPEKLALLERLGAVAVNYREAGWADRVREATGGVGVDVLFESVAGEVGHESSQLVAPFGRTVMFGAKNAREAISADRARRLIYEGQALVGFHMRMLRPEQIAESVSTLFELVCDGRLKLFAETSYPLAEASAALEALSSRRTVGKIVLVP